MFLTAIVAIENFRDQTVKSFRDEESGIALTEYLILLGLLVGGVIAAVIAFGGGLSTAWNSWTGWITGSVAYGG